MSKRPKSLFPRRSPINLSRSAFRHLTAALALSLFAPLAHADWNKCTLITADQKEQRNLTINTWTPADGLSVTTEAGKLVTIPSRNILSLSSGSERIAPSNPASQAWTLSLQNGDTLYGSVNSLSGKSLLFDAPDIGRVAVPLKRVVSFSAPSVPGSAKPVKIAAAADRDILLFKEGGDRLEGLVASIANDTLNFMPLDGDTPTPIELRRIQTVLLGGAKPLRAVPPLSVRLTFTSGSILTIPLDPQQNAFNWTLNQLTLKDPAGQDHPPTSVNRVTHIEVLGGRVVNLTELDPESESQTAFLGAPFPYQINKNALGQPLRVAQQTFPSGIGVHTQSTLVYQLDGSFDTLTLRVGLDDSAAPLGEAHASVILDGKTLYDAPALKPGSLSEPLLLSVKGGHRLELHADSASHLDVQGRVNWLSPTLHRP